MNQNLEQLARDRIDRQLTAAGWILQSKKTINLAAATGVAIRENTTEVGPAAYILFVDRKPVGVIEAKREEEAVRLTTVEEQSSEYALAKLKYINSYSLFFVHESAGKEGVLFRYSIYSTRHSVTFTGIKASKQSTLWLPFSKDDFLH